MSALLLSASFLSAALLFCLEPMVGKMVLPLLGGTPAVWNTCLVFFQTALLAGYAYAHGTLSWLGVSRQARLHSALIVLAFFSLPVLVTPLDVVRWPADASLGPRLFLLLSVRVGVPFVLLAATAPLLQRWLSLTSSRRAHDPYFLYATSNAGSLLALLAYPLIIEPWLGGSAQRQAWRWGYAVFAAMISVAAILAARIAPGLASPAVPVAPPLPGRLLRRWIILAAAPSALLIGVTTYLSTEVASVPLLWVVPLAVYLVTFMLAFAGRRRLSTRLASRFLPVPLICAFIVAAAEATVPIWLALVLNLVTLFLAGMVCHGSLADERPAPAHLTGFYLAVAAGGALGGALATFVPPVVFTSVLEYPLELLLIALLRPATVGQPDGGRLQAGDLRWAMFIGALSLLIALVLRALAVPPGPITIGLQLGVPIVVHYRFLHSPVRFALGLALLLVVARVSLLSPFPRIIHSERTFFGLLRVIDTPDGRYRRLMHGTTVHGGQATAAAERNQPSTYYARRGPLGQIFERVFDAAGAGAELRSVAVVGLGAGEVAAYAKPGQAWTFYEIDPAVVRIAGDRRYFTYLADAFPDNRGLRVELGDARLRLQDARDGGFDLLILDAFSSDAIPTHLLVREAVALYVRKLTPDGVLAVHISNRYLRLEPVIAALARDAGLMTACQFDGKEESQGDRPSKSASHWCALSRDPGRLGPLLATRAWHPAAPSAGPRPRPSPTDDRSSIFQMF